MKGLFNKQRLGKRLVQYCPRLRAANGPDSPTARYVATRHDVASDCDGHELRLDEKDRKQRGIPLSLVELFVHI